MLSTPSRNVPIVVGVYAKVPTPRMDWRLYNLRDDPGEHENLIANQPDRAGELTACYAAEPNS